MSKKQRAVAIFCVVISIAAFVLVALGGGMLRALQELFGTIGLGSDQDVFSSSLGMGVLAVYAAGTGLGFAALRWPLAMGIAMLPLGVCAFLFGGPVSKVYGILLFAAGAILIALCLRQRSPASTR